MNKNALATLGTIVAVLGLVVFFQRAYFAQMILGASTPTEQELIRLSSGLGDPNSQRLLEENGRKELEVTLVAGVLFFVGSGWTVIAASGRDRHEETPGNRDLIGMASTKRKTPEQVAKESHNDHGKD